MLLNEIKQQQLAARKARDKLKTALLTTLIGEIEAVGKAKNRQTTEDEAVAVVKKMLKNNAITIEAYGEDAPQTVLEEKFILESYLPKQMTEERLREVIEDFVKTAKGANIGQVMQYLKHGYSGKYDAKIASKIAREVTG